jgi:hypothetical protein
MVNKKFKYKDKWYKLEADPNLECSDCAFTIGTAPCLLALRGLLSEEALPCDDGKYHRGIYRELDSLYGTLLDTKEKEESDE